MGVATAWDKRKGFLDYLKLASILPPLYVIMLVGLTEKMKAQLPANVTGIGKTKSQDELAALYSMADVVTSLSVSESMGMTPVEGFACGTPAIVYDNTAQPELVTQETGLVVRSGDVKSVSCAVLEICEKGKHHYSKACRERAEGYFSKDYNFQQYIELYNMILTR